MIRPHFLIDSLSLIEFPLLDATFKGSLVLLLAGAVCLALRRDSAATRHLVWATAVMLLLAIPILSLSLPEWRVLPNWPQVNSNAASMNSFANRPNRPTPDHVLSEAAESPPLAEASNRPSQIGQPSGAEHSHVELPLPPRRDVRFRQGRDYISTRATSAAPLFSTVWVAGLVVLMVRLIIADLLLRSSARRCRVLAASEDSVVTGLARACSMQEKEQHLRAALHAATQRLAVTRSIDLLLDPRPSMPVVWGLLRVRMRLPAEAVNWSLEQQQSVLLHELAHVRRNDLVILTLTQLACALNWFNPLMWFAAWRLHVECERACDDLVLSAGVRPSTYAGHLVEVVSHVRPAAWIQQCGLAMARKSSLESRLTAVLSAQMNRRGLTRLLVMAVIIIGSLIAVPVAMLHATGQDDPASSAEKKNVDTETGTDSEPASNDDVKIASPSYSGSLPKSKEAQSLFLLWYASARADGSIPGGRIGLLAESIETFVKNNPTWETTPQLRNMLPRFDAAHDWSALDAIVLLDELAAVETSPIESALFEERKLKILTGAPLPPDLVKAPWGTALPNGLRLACLLEPRGQKQQLNAVLKARVLIHNSGKQSVAFRAPTWHQGRHKASNSSGEEIQMHSEAWLTLSRMMLVRLAPDEFVELDTTGIGVGTRENSDNWQNLDVRVGSWLDVKVGDVVTLTTSPVSLGAGNGLPQPDDPPAWWRDHITARLAREAPLPADAASRTLLLQRVSIDLFGTSLGAEEMAAFVSDGRPNALDSLAQRLARRKGLIPYTGLLASGPTKFLVVPANDPKKPRSANQPGQYLFGDSIVLAINGRPEGERIVNEARIQFYSTGPNQNAPAAPHPLTLPDGDDTWAAAWVHGGNTLWIQEPSGFRSYDFSNPSEVNEEAAEPDQVPAEIREALQRAMPEQKSAP